MRKLYWKKLALLMLGGGALFQVAGCAETAIYVQSIASAVTAGGVLYLVQQVMD